MMKRLIGLFILCTVISITNEAKELLPENEGIYDVYGFGATGDGSTLENQSIQSAIDKCHEDGGGKVNIHNGQFVSGTLYLKSNVILHIEAGAVLRASNDLDDFPITDSKYPSYGGTFVTNKMLIYAEDAKNISITGRGTIDGNGDHWADGPFGSPSFNVRPRIIHFRGCENIHILNITLYNSASWVQSYQSCKNMLIEGITVDSRPNKDIEKERFADARDRNTDGLDLIDCQQVRIANCHFNSGDDAICLKTFSPDEGTRDIVVNNCVISANSSGIKLGTESAGAFSDITITNCVVYDTRNDAIALLTADGARMERVLVSNISMRNIKGPAIAVRLGIRNRIYRQDATINTPYAKDITIENIKGTIASQYACSISGIKAIPVENITLRNIDLHFEGGGTLEDALREIPEQEKAYPSGRTFGKTPAYGIFIRHARNITLDKVQFGFDRAEDRPAVIAEDVHGFEIKSLKAQATTQMAELIRLTNTKDVIISESRSFGETPTFLSVNGENTDNVVLRHYPLLPAKQTVKYEYPDLKKVVKEITN